MNTSLRRTFLTLVAVLVALLAYSAPAQAHRQLCYTCGGECPLSVEDGQTLCLFYCDVEDANWNCDEDEACPPNWWQLNCPPPPG